ncbi:serine hydrolase domain-containing protein [Sphingobium sp. Ant17]|uniref:serine hydrolase domain-containing protein n=1 Tax=Sphingobium sp. Ant17 TaxID=1461752 RepID=UPI00044A0AF4|nr:serine hydrolase [Sphingobium sp. Ant17]EXS70253.1 6-aminohexanoate hydrolase [Sphingobium sp. Ant17]
MTRRTVCVAALMLVLASCAPDPAANASEPNATAPGTPAAATATRGLDPTLIAAAVAKAEALPRLRSLLILRDGTEEAAHRFHDGPALDRPVNIKSASKTVISALVGMAIDRDMLDGIDQPVAPLLKADLPANPDPRLSRITIGHLLSMQSGLQRTSGQYYGAWVTSPNWVRYALSRPFVEEPGGVMLYSTGNSHLLSAILTRTTGRGTDRLAREWLGKPLGIQIPSWARDPQGIAFGGNDMLMSPRGLARFGELYRNGGRVDGRQILSETWIADSWRPRGVSPWSGNGYGFGWFASEAAGHRVHFAWGYGGQMLYIVPSLNLTVVMTSDSAPHPRAESHIAELHALLADYIVPAARKGNA